MCEALSETEGVKINGEKIKTIRYTDDTAVIATSEDELQRMMHKIQAKCDEYGMSLNTEKTKVMKIMANENDTVLAIKVKSVQVEQVEEYKYLGSLIEEDMRCIKEVRTRIGMAKTAFWNYKELLKRDVMLQLRQRMLDCSTRQVSSFIWVRNMDFYQRNPGENQRLPALVLQTHAENQIL